MSYEVMGSLIERREDAVKALVESFLWGGGNNSPEQVAEALRDPEATVEEMVREWDMGIGMDDSVSREEALRLMQSAVAVKYMDPIESESILYDEESVRDVEREDPSLILRIHDAA